MRSMRVCTAMLTIDGSGDARPRLYRVFKATPNSPKDPGDFHPEKCIEVIRVSDWKSHVFAEEHFEDTDEFGAAHFIYWELHDLDFEELGDVHIDEIRGVAIGTLTKIKLADKLRALELLGRHLGMFNDKLTLAGDKENPLVLLLKQVQGSALRPAPLRVVGEAA